ncbi:MAG: DMT family transporter [Bacteroidales bacterium]|nr:DMT family transporter [Bacteroidales bacterium]MCF8334281.1 DMT family transporter [Bacteroidales bacterium]
MKNIKNYKYLPYLILAILALTWGSSFILIKKGLIYFSDTEVGALRIVIAFSVFIPLAFKRRHKIARRHFIYLAIVGFIGSAAPAFLFAKAETGIDSNLAGILNSLTPLFTFIISFAFFRFKARWFNLLGLLLALSGAIGLIVVSGEGNIAFNFTYASFVIIATLCYAINVNVIHYKLRDLDNITIVTYGFTFAGIPTLIYLLFFTPFINTMSTGAGAIYGLGYIAILGIIGTSLALMIFYYLIQTSNTVFASSVTYLIPIVAVMWGVIDGEVFRLSYFLWIALILYGIYLVNTKKLFMLNRLKYNSKQQTS